MSKPAFSETDLVASICRESFYEFLKEFWDVIIPEEPVWNWHIEYLCDQLQTMAERVFQNKPKKYDLVINVSPGSTKSTIASVAFPAWTWTRFPTARHICGSHAFDLGMDLSRKCRDIISEQDRHDNKPSFHDCFPNIKLREDQNTKGYFANTMGGMRKSVTVGGKSPVGFHGHFIVIDDPIDPQKVLSEAEIQKANSWMNETLPSRKVDKAVTPMILIMQRLHQNDPTGNRLAQKDKGGKVKHISLPADLEEGYELKPRFLKKYYQDGLMDESRMPRHILREARNQLGEFGYSGQYGQSPVPLGGGMFKVDRIVLDQEPVPARIRRRVRFWDKAGTAGGGAYTVGLLLGLDKDDRYWVLDVVRGQWDSSQREKVIEQTALVDGRDVIIGIEQEPGSGGKESAEATVRRLAGFRVKVDRPTGDKAWRADPFSSQVNGHNVSMKPADWNQSFLEELRFFPASTYKDQVDAASGAFNMLAIIRRKVGALV
jgi:predicted phage terminase large subunit-like protein